LQDADGSLHVAAWNSRRRNAKAKLAQSDSVMGEAEQKPVASVKDVRGLCTKRIALQAMGAMYLLLNWLSASPLWEVE